MTGTAPGLRRELGALESYAILVGMLVGAGIFAVTADAGAIAGPSVVLGYLVLAPVVLASAVPYLVYLTTPLGLEPGGEVLNIARTFELRRLTFVAAWLKCVSYLGAAAYLADALAAYLVELVTPGQPPAPAARTALALAGLGFFWFVHTRSVRWFGRLQVGMCLLLLLALVVLIVPGLFAIEADNLRPFFAGGTPGFLRALPMLFFAYAGFESLAQSAGEVRDSQRRLPAVFVRGLLATTVLFGLMALVAFGALPSGELGESSVPMSRAAAVYLPFGARELVTVGAIMAIATSMNATLLVPARLCWNLAARGLMPRAFGRLHPRSMVPAFGVSTSCAVAMLLVLSGQRQLALGIAISALMALYALHSAALLALPRLRPALYAQARTRLPRRLQVAAAALSVAALLAVLGVQLYADLQTLLGTSWLARIAAGEPTTLELLVGWILLGLALQRLGRRALP